MLRFLTFVVGAGVVGLAGGQTPGAHGQQAQNAEQQAIQAQQGIGLAPTDISRSQLEAASKHDVAETKNSAQTPKPGEQTAVLQVNTQLVIVDVVVTTKDGNPVHGLKPEMFQLNEGGVAQKVRHFEEHSTLQPATTGPALPKLPPGMFTDYMPVTPDETLNILLMDSLNTPASAQSYVHTQLEEYIKHAKPGTRIAIFGLANQLVMLQGFTSDPETLKEAVHHKLIARYSSLLDDPGGNGNDQASTADTIAGTTDLTSATSADAGITQLAANFQQFQAETEAIQVQLRLQYTLDAFNALGHYLAAFPGRKNLIWFSGSFPLSILPNPALTNPFGVASVNQDEFREMTNLLAKAQVAVYPVDARGLATPTTYTASSSGRRYGPNPQNFSRDVSTFTSSQNAEHSTMDDLAGSTGGQAFYNTNGLSDAVAKAIDSGSNYYTLAYAPSDRKEDGGFRKIHVDFSGPVKGGAQLSYRQGYYTKDATQKTPDRTVSATATGSNAAAATGGPAATAAAFQRVAMSRGAPTPEEMLFTVRVLPSKTTTEDSVAFGNQLGPGVSAKGPFRRYDVDYVALPKDVTLTLQPDGRRTGGVDFLVYVFDVDGALLNTHRTSVSFNLPPADYKKFMQNAIQAHLEVSAPAKGESFLRVGVRDDVSNKFGVVEVATSAVKQLAPPVYQAAPVAAPK